MTACEFCGMELFERKDDDKSISFCNKDCLSQYCDEYVKDNWRDYCNMMGVRVIE